MLAILAVRPCKCCFRFHHSRKLLTIIVPPFSPNHSFTTIWVDSLNNFALPSLHPTIYRKISRVHPYSLFLLVFVLFLATFPPLSKVLSLESRSQQP